MDDTLRERVRVLFHLNGYTKVMVERTEGLGLADGGIVWEISTAIIPAHLRRIGSRFLVLYRPPSQDEINDIDALRRALNNLEITELSEA